MTDVFTDDARHTLRFGPIDVVYDSSVLEPRPWTLAQSRWAAQLARTAPPGPILELCCGAGHIGLAAAVLAGRELVQVDVDPAACELADANAARTGWRGAADVRHGALDAALEPHERFPIILADPPYVPSGEVGRYPDDPVTAIDGGADGLTFVRRCLAVAARHLSAGGTLVLQLRGPAQVAASTELAVEAGLAAAGSRTFGPDRALLAASLARPR